MTASDWLLILAVLLSPIVAIRVSRALDRRQERRRRLTDAFHTLLATRTEKATPGHAQGLNTIGMEFHARRLLGPLSYHSANDAKVHESWHVYRLHLNTPPIDAAGAAYTSDIITWQRRADELLNDLLGDLARTLGYGFGRGFIERGMYTPSPAPTPRPAPATAMRTDSEPTPTTPTQPPSTTEMETTSTATAGVCTADDGPAPRDYSDKKKKKKRDRKDKPGGLPRFSSPPPRGN